MPVEKSFSESQADKDPFVQFDKWYKDHLSHSNIYPDSFSLATASGSGNVSVRTVLLKEYGKNGFVFFTNYESRKGIQMSENPYVAMLFYWTEVSRQVRIEGKAERLTVSESYKYFSSRPRESQAGAWASIQGRIIPGREYLDKRYLSYERKFAGLEIPMPPYWGGYRIIPSRFEFWQEGKHRLHDRIVYTPGGDSWKIVRLSP